MSIRVAVVEDQAELRSLVVELISGADGFACAGAYPTAEAALEALPRQMPHVALLDLELPGMSGLDLIRRLSEQWPALNLLVVTIHDDPYQIFRALEAGASGYLVKPVPAAKLLEAIADIHAGGSPMSSQIARLVVKSFRERGRARRDLEGLTPREEEILRLVSQGHALKHIASELKLSLSTVGTHLRNIYSKLHVNSRAQATAKYLQP